MKKTIWIGLTLSLLGFVSVSSARADDIDKKTVLIFSQPVEIPGKVLPAGTYTFKVAEMRSDRHVVQVFNADGSMLIATVLTISDYRLTATDRTVITFSEAPAGVPEVLRAWFYPGNTAGEEFVYSRARAAQLAKASKTIVPAMPVDVANADELKTVPIVALTPEEKELGVADAIQTTPRAMMADNSATTGRNARKLPKTASVLPLIMLLGLGAIGLASGLMIFGKREAPAVL